MRISRYLLAGLIIGVLSIIYSLAVFSMFGFYPDLIFVIDFLPSSNIDFYIAIFIKNFLVGTILTVLFSAAYTHITHDRGRAGDQAKGIFFFVLYAIFALISFTVGDILLMRTQEGMLLLLTVDGLIESFIATIPIKLFVISS